MAKPNTFKLDTLSLHAGQRLYPVRLADQLDIDLSNTIERKISLNEAKYPVDLVRGSAKK
jgi:hypothetical protein